MVAGAVVAVPWVVSTRVAAAGQGQDCPTLKATVRLSRPAANRLLSLGPAGSAFAVFGGRCSSGRGGTSNARRVYKRRRQGAAEKKTRDGRAGTHGASFCASAGLRPNGGFPSVWPRLCKPGLRTVWTVTGGNGQSLATEVSFWERSGA